MKCKTCKYWSRKSDGYLSREILDPVDQDTFQPMAMPFLVGECKNPDLLFCERPLRSNGFAVADGSEYWATLYTGEDHGCVLHTVHG